MDEQKVMLKSAAEMLNINYSTAKTILRIWRIEKRICKKYGADTKARLNKGKIFKVIGGSNVTDNQIQKCGSFTLMETRCPDSTLASHSNLMSSPGVEMTISKHNFTLSHFKPPRKLSPALVETFSIQPLLKQKRPRPPEISTQNQVSSEIHSLYQSCLLETRRMQVNFFLLKNLKQSLLNALSLSPNGVNMENYLSLYSCLEKLGV